MTKLYILSFTRLLTGPGCSRRLFLGPYVDPAPHLAAKAKDEAQIGGGGFCYINAHGDSVGVGEPTCSAPAMEHLKSVLDIEANQVMSIWTENKQELVGYWFRPAIVTYNCEYPTYEEIAEQLPSHIHYFQKYPDVDFPLVTETFVNCVKQNKIKGLRFPPKYDGKKVLGMKFKTEV